MYVIFPSRHHTRAIHSSPEIIIIPLLIHHARKLHAQIGVGEPNEEENQVFSVFISRRDLDAIIPISYTPTIPILYLPENFSNYILVQLINISRFGIEVKSWNCGGIGW